MLVVQVEIWPYGNKDQAKTLGAMKIVNRMDHPKRPEYGNYDVDAIAEIGTDQGSETQHLHTQIKGFPRNWGFWALVGNAFAKLMNEVMAWEKAAPMPDDVEEGPSVQLHEV